MLEKKISQAEARKIFWGFIDANLLFLAANVLAVFANTFLNQFLIEMEYQPIVRKAQQDSLIMITANILPFPMTIFIILYNYRHLIRSIKKRLLDEQALRSIIDMPIKLSLIAAFGWLFGTIVFQAQLYFRDFTNDGKMLLSSTLITLCTAAITFVLSYHMLEYFQRRYFVKKIFHKSEFMGITQARRLVLLTRFYIYAFATTVIPGFIMFRLAQILNNNGQNVFGRNLSWELNTLFFIIFITTLTITILLVRSIRTPLKSMQHQASRIAAEDYSYQTLVDTRDEIGELSASMNSMTTSLAEKEFIKDTFGRMVDPAIRDHLLSGNVNLGGNSAEAVILFSDLEGFTRLSESQSPDQVVGILNEYFTVMADCIAAHNGIINKFIGDAILAVFGMPVKNESAADSALSCAIAMQRANAELNQKFAQRGISPLNTRIGIHYGMVVAGNIGSKSRMEYTVIGDTVNTASRLESSCKKVGLGLLFSDSVKQKLNGHYPLKMVGNLKLKGKNTVIKTWTVA